MKSPFALVILFVATMYVCGAQPSGSTPPRSDPGMGPILGPIQELLYNVELILDSYAVLGPQESASAKERSIVATLNFGYQDDQSLLGRANKVTKDPIASVVQRINPRSRLGVDIPIDAHIPTLKNLSLGQLQKIKFLFNASIVDSTTLQTIRYRRNDNANGNLIVELWKFPIMMDVLKSMDTTPKSTYVSDAIPDLLILEFVEHVGDPNSRRIKVRWRIGVIAHK